MREPDHDPHRTPEASPAFRRPLALAGAVLGVLAVFVAPVATGVVGMVAGLVAHVKGDRLGFVAATVAALGMVAGMALEFFVTR